MKSIKFKRVMAIVIDLLIVGIISYLLSSVNFLNPKRDKYKASYDTYYKEYATVMKNVTDPSKVDFSDTFIKAYYDVNKYSISYMIIDISVAFLYFSLFPFFNNNQTIGKQIMKIQVYSNKKEKVPFYKYLLRPILLPMYTKTYNLIYCITNILFILYMSPKLYFDAVLYLNTIYTIYISVSIIYFFVKKDNSTIHDKLLKTSVDSI